MRLAIVCLAGGTVVVSYQAVIGVLLIALGLVLLLAQVFALLSDGFDVVRSDRASGNFATPELSQHVGGLGVGCVIFGMAVLVTGTLVTTGAILIPLGVGLFVLGRWMARRAEPVSDYAKDKRIDFGTDTESKSGDE